MKIHALLSRWSALGLALATNVLLADSVYSNGIGNYKVTVHDSSTLFADTVTFNGATASFRGLGSLQGTDGSGPTSATLDGTLSATFVADPGYVFDSAFLSFGQWSYSNSLGYAGHGHTGTWSIPGSTYAGGTNPPEQNYPASDAWSGNGSSGSFSRYNYFWWTGGGSSFMPVMDGSILLNGMSSFTLTLDLSIFVGNTSYYGWSSFDTAASTTFAPPPPPPGNEVPDTLPMLSVLGAAFAGMSLVRRRATA